MLQIYSKVSDFFTVIEKYNKIQPFQMLQIHSKKKLVLERGRPSDVFVSVIRFFLCSEIWSAWGLKNDPSKVQKIVTLSVEKWSYWKLKDVLR